MRVVNGIIKSEVKEQDKFKEVEKMKKFKETIKVDGIKFDIGIQGDAEFHGKIFAMHKDNKTYGVLFVNNQSRELGFRSGILANDNELQAIEKARTILNEKLARR